MGATSSFAHETGKLHNSAQGEQSSLIQIEKLITKNKAKRLTRKFLFSRGFSKSIGPGGAHVRKIESAGEFWLIEVALRNDSAANIKKEILYINKRSGNIMEVLPDATRLAEVTKSN